MTEPSPASCRAAILVLLHGLADEQRQNAAAFLLRDIVDKYVAGGRPPPTWIGELLTSGVFPEQDKRTPLLALVSGAA